MYLIDWQVLRRLGANYEIMNVSNWNKRFYKAFRQLDGAAIL